MSKIWLTSDTHFGHDRDFVWKVRGFKNVDEMNKEIVRRWNSVVSEDDIIYHLGDIMLGDNAIGLSYLKQLNGTIYIAYGNHDTQSRIDEYLKCHNVADVQMGYRIKAGKKTCILTHYPTVTANGADTKTLNLYGHTHQTTNFYDNRPYMYHVGVDSHNCYPILLEDVLNDIRKESK
jgi:calcineurin-like phosphoesterase family protein